MKGRSRNEAGSRKLIDHLGGEPEHGEPLAMLATTFDLNADFVELDFLPSFLRIPAWDDTSVRARVQLESALARMNGVALMMEATRFGGRPRSLRVDLTPASAPDRGVLHAKVVLAVYQRAVRLLVASANLTEAGYRHNREIALSLLAHAKRPEHGALIRQAIAEMPRLLGPWWTEAASRVVRSAEEYLDEWEIPAESEDERFVWGGGEAPIWQQYVRRWPEGEPVRSVDVVSPFWSQEGPDGQLGRLLRGLRDRGAETQGARIRLTTAAASDTSSTYLPVLHPSFASFDFRSLGVTVEAIPANPKVDPEDVGRDDLLHERRLHAKVVVVRGTTTTLAYLGSANFTVPGWGFGSPRSANIEAGVVLRRRGKAAEELVQSLLPPTVGSSVLLNGGASLSLAMQEPELEGTGWPTFLERAELRPTPGVEGRLNLVLILREGARPAQWAVSLEASSPPCLEAPPDGERERSLPLGEVELSLLLRTQSIFVTWSGLSGEPIGFPVNVTLAARERLPFGDPQALPNEHDLVAFYQGHIAFEDMFPEPATKGPSDHEEPANTTANPSMVDTSKILSYQVRNFVEALSGIREELVRSAVAESAIRFAVLGPISPVALAREVEKAVQNGRSAVAAAFQLTELVACLRGAKAHAVDARLREAWEQTLDEGEGEILAATQRLLMQHPDLARQKAFAKYAKAVLNRALTGVGS